MEFTRWPAILVIFLASFTCVVDFSQAIKTGKLTRFRGNNLVLNGEKDSAETYIVFVEKRIDAASKQADDLISYYASFLPAATATATQQSRIVYAYTNVASGFAAKLTAGEAKVLQQKPGVLSARPQKVLSLHTTHTPQFLGLQQNVGVWKQTNYGEGVIIGLLDTGTTPGHPSFNDVGMPSPPAKWKGKCDPIFQNITACNKKLIGLRSFVSDDGRPNSPKTSPLDDIGHGTHTSSTAAGTFVQGANLFGNANGTAAGIAPLAHIAMYKVCSQHGCSESAILAGMDAAVEDGVDVLSLSLGGLSAAFYNDPIAIGAYGAMQKGVFVSCSAGNSGPFNTSLSNEAPWILTVGASTIDRNLRVSVRLGIPAEYDGQSAFQHTDRDLTQLPLVFPGVNGSISAASCSPGTFRNFSVTGKIVLCVAGEGVGLVQQGQTVKDAGGAAIVVMNNEILGFTTFASAHVLPASHVSYSEGMAIQAYIKSTPNPTATILFKGTIIGDQTAPSVAFFSSRGPNLASPGILKPDIIGPGVNILAAWPTSVENITTTKSTFNIISGTSMSCPHLAGVVSLLKSAHPSWTPAALKSAIMTTAYQKNLGAQPIYDEQRKAADVLAIGAGHVDPTLANDPGLIYDIQPSEYIPYLCGLGYTEKQIAILVQQKVDCSKTKPIEESQLNYPSFSILLGNETKTFTRTVTNVGVASSTYKVQVVTATGVGVSVKPETLVFNKVNQKLTYSVSFTKTNGGTNGLPTAEGSISWVYNRQYTVRSPISIIFK